MSGIMSQKISDQSLIELGGVLAPDDSRLETVGKRTVREILSEIQDHSGCPIDRFCLSGSVGHQRVNSNDSIGFDITVFIHTHDMGLEIATEKVLRVVALHTESILQIDHLGGHFVMNGYPINLAVAPALGHKMHIQRKAIWDEIEMAISDESLSPSDLDRFSISLHESLAAFMHLGDPLLHGLVRLARLWRQNAILASGCDELSTLATVLVMMRCIEVERSRGLCLVASRTGRTKLAAFPSEKIFCEFLEYFCELDCVAMTWPRFYDPDTISDRVVRKQPYILDPVNPWRNVIETMTPEGIDWIKHAARHALNLIQARAPLKCLFSPPPSIKRRGG
jgi:hypothetical protein